MKNIRTRLLILIIMIFCISFTTPAYATTLEKDGLEITFITDKNQYKQQDTIQAILTITNTNDLAKPEFSLEIETPIGYTLSEISQEIEDAYSLMPGESISFSVFFDVLDSILLPQTGDNSNIILWAVLMMIAALTLYVIKKNVGKRSVSLILCIVLLISSLGNIPIVNADTNNRTRLELYTTAYAGEQKITINAKIQYNFLPLESWLDMTDTDGDGLVNGLEEYYGTDQNNVDTDGDGLSDYIEVAILGTNPLKVDTNNNAISDGNEDFDADTLSNLSEVINGTSPIDADSDADGLMDNEEPDYGTDPTDYDTDDDGASDGDEIHLGTNPLVANNSFVVTAVSSFEDSVTPSVTATLAGKQVDSLVVDPMVGSPLFPEDMPGYLGMAYNFTVDGEFDSATIRFEFDESLIAQGKQPTIFYFNEEEQSLEELPTTINGNVASTTVEHFSTYVLIDRIAYYDAFKWEDTWDDEGDFSSVEIVLVIDDSGSMYDNDYYDERLTVARNLIDNLPDGSKIGIVWFANDSICLTPTLTSDKASAKAYLSTNYFRSSGGTYMYTAINDAFSLFESNASDTLKMMVVLSDGNSSDLSRHSSTITTARTKNVRIYTVGLGSSTSYFNRYLKPLAEQTDGIFYLASNAGQLSDIYNDINRKIDIETDTDGDTIPDYYEDHLFSFNGKKIDLDKNDPCHDADGDGLLDQQEVEIKLVYNADRTKVYVKGKYSSFPDMVDSDNDGINDKDDPEPLEYTITDRTLSFIEGLSYTNLATYKGKTVGYALDHGVTLKGISSEYANLLKDAIIVDANDSGVGYWKDFWDSGLGSISLKITRKTKPSAIIYSLRGTEPNDDILNDGEADLALGVGIDTLQSKNAFAAYKKIATSHSYTYYVTGHSLGGRLAQDVVYKIYDANEGGWFKTKANLPVPIHSATFNALGYNALNYALLENDILDRFNNKMSNFYYWQDLVGEGLGNNGLFKHAGLEIKLLCKDINGHYYRQDDLNNWFNVNDITYHGINYFHNDYDLLYTSPHPFTYWIE